MKSRIGVFFFTAMLVLTASAGLATAEIKSDDEAVRIISGKYKTAQLFNQSSKYDTDELVIKFRDGVTAEQRQSLIQTEHLIEQSSIPEANITLAKVREPQNLKSFALNLTKYQIIEYVEPNFQVKQSYVPKDPQKSKQWYLDKIQAPKAWDLTKGSPAITVAVIDDGVQLDHPDLIGKIVKPYNVITGKTTMYGRDHGTHVAGIIAATMNNQGIAGIAPNVKIMPINVFRSDVAETFDLVQALYYAADNQANVINMSLGGFEYSNALQDAINHAKNKNIILVAAAGNESTSKLPSPANINPVIAVGATNKSDQLTSFSNYGTIDLSAPGDDIYSSVTRSSYRMMDGTSMASPIVSGVVALMLSKNPVLTAKEVESILIGSVDDLGKVGKDKYGYGRVNAYRAVKNTPLPVLKIEASTAPYILNGQKRYAISVKIRPGARVSITVKNKEGRIVRRLVTKQFSSNGTVIGLWDGKADHGGYVGGGDYRIEASVTNGIETLSKAIPMKVIDQIKPAVTDTTYYYSAAFSTGTSIPFILNKPGYVTAVLYDSSGKKIQTLLSNEFYDGGKQWTSWDGKDEAGNKVADDSYQLVITLESSTGKATGQSTVVVDSVQPTAAIEFPTPIFKVTGNNSVTAQIETNEKIHVTMTIFSDFGNKLETIMEDELFQPGKTDFEWDRHTYYGQVTEGEFYYILEITDLAGNTSTIQSSNFTIENWLAPEITCEKGFVFDGKGSGNPCIANKQGLITAEVYKGDQLIKRLLVDEQVGEDEFYISWNGVDENNNKVPDGFYQLKVNFQDKYGQQIAFTDEIALSTGVILETSPYVHLESGEYPEVKFNVHESALVTIQIESNRYGEKKIVRTIMKDKPFEEGIHQFTWDGKNDNGVRLLFGEYTYTIKGINQYGKSMSVSGKFDFRPPTQLLNVYIGVSKGIAPQSLEISTSDPNERRGKVYLYAYQSKLDPIPFETKEYQLSQTLHTFTYTKPTSETIYYKIVYEDNMETKTQVAEGEI